MLAVAWGSGIWLMSLGRIGRECQIHISGEAYRILGGATTGRMSPADNVMLRRGCSGIAVSVSASALSVGLAAVSKRRRRHKKKKSPAVMPQGAEVCSRREHAR
jgi:hypothetical protein